MISEFDGMALYPWLVASPALVGSVTTLLSGKLSDVYGRRWILLGSMGLFLSGMVLVPLSRTMLHAVLAVTFMSLGHWPIVPLCAAAVGDLFPPEQRARWTGLLAISSWAAAMTGPILGGLLSESQWGWRSLYYGMIPLILFAGILTALGVPEKRQGKQLRFDTSGTIVMVIANTALIFGFSRIGTADTWVSGVILLILSAVAWVSFVKIENKAHDPILDPHLFTNRTFLRIAATGFLSFFGSLSIGAYATIFVQDVMRVSPTISGSLLTPFTVLVAFMGIPTGFLLAKTMKPRWMYILSYTLLTLALLVMWHFTANTPLWVFVFITMLAGIGLGVIPTLNTLVVQFSVPGRLLGLSVGALFFFQMVGIAVAPTILGLVQKSVPDLEGGIQRIYLVGGICMAVALIMISRIPKTLAIREEPVEPEP
jgi:MFS family permease